MQKLFKCVAVSLVVLGLAVCTTTDRVAGQSPASQEWITSVPDHPGASADPLPASWYVYVKWTSRDAWAFDSEQPSQSAAEDRVTFLQVKKRAYSARWVKVGR